jgi:hypothetical protein
MGEAKSRNTKQEKEEGERQDEQREHTTRKDQKKTEERKRKRRIPAEQGLVVPLLVLNSNVHLTVSPLHTTRISPVFENKYIYLILS